MRNRLYFAIIFAIAPAALVSACSHSSLSDLVEAGADATTAALVASDAALDASADAIEEPDVAYVRPDVHRVLHLGDSTVGFAGGLTKALRPMFTDAGVKYYGDSYTAAGIQSYDDDDKNRLAVLIKAFKPDMIIINMGMNNLTVPHPEVLVGHIKSLVKKIIGDGPAPRVCYWIGPPAWRPDRGLLNPVLAANIAPCIFFDSSSLVLERQKDKIHPTDKGGEIWAKHFWYFFNTGKELIDDDVEDGGGVHGKK
ncbi:MAG: SGNH/GDSL hydrolase family protein [Polyangiaceae bacterium]